MSRRNMIYPSFSEIDLLDRALNELAALKEIHATEHWCHCEQNWIDNPPGTHCMECDGTTVLEQPTGSEVKIWENSYRWLKSMGRGEKWRKS